MKVLVTGAVGFLGSHIADRLGAQGHEIIGIDTLLTGRRENWQGDLLLDRVDGLLGVEGYNAADRMTEAQPDLIVHCAASYSDRDKWHRDAWTNVQGSINVAIAARNTGARVIYFQTALIYGQNPYRELGPVFTDADAPERFGYDDHTDPSIGPRPLKVTAPLNPESSYAISKLAGEQYLRNAEIPLLTFRLANVYGPRNLSGPIPTFWKRISEGKPCTVTDTRRDFVYVDDLVNLVVQAANGDQTGTYHVSTGRDYPIGQVYSAVADCLDAQHLGQPEETPRGEDDAPTILLDPTTTRRDFGWQATTDLMEGIDAAVDWYNEHGVEQTFSHLKEPVSK